MSLANNLRPRKMCDVLGQSQVTDVLEVKLRDRSLAQCMIFAGKYGCGKTTVARIVASAVTCENPGEDGEPCCCCGSCRSLIDNGASANVLELDAATYRGINDIRAVIEQAQLPPQGRAKKKVVILDECHMLTTEASNALLKTLEEPPEWCMFILCTTEADRILPTIKSRCQVFRFDPISEETMAGTVKGVLDEEGVLYEPRVPMVIAHLAHGSFRDALSSVEQCMDIMPEGETLTVKTVSEINGIASMDGAYTILASCIDGDARSVIATLMEARTENVSAIGYLDAIQEMLLDALSQVSGVQVNSGYDLSFVQYEDIAYLCNLVKVLADIRGRLSTYNEPYLRIAAGLVGEIYAEQEHPTMVPDGFDPATPQPVMPMQQNVPTQVPTAAAAVYQPPMQGVPAPASVPNTPVIPQPVQFGTAPASPVPPAPAVPVGVDGFVPLSPNDEVPFDNDPPFNGGVKASDFFGTATANSSVQKECASSDDELSADPGPEPGCTEPVKAGQGEQPTDPFDFGGFSGFGF